MGRYSLLALAIWLILSLDARAGRLERLDIQGYSGEAMEPFVSRDGRFLFFNTRNDPGVNTNIHFAERRGQSYMHRGELPGTISPQLDGTPTMSADGRFCFVSTRAYFTSLVSVYCGLFDGKQVNDVKPQRALAGSKLGFLTFDVDLSADGKFLIYAEGNFSGGAVPDAANLYQAAWTGSEFKRDVSADRLYVHVNTPDLEYAPALSNDGMALYFTRLTGFWIFRSAQLFVARRKSLDAPFDLPKPLSAIEGFVEAATIAPDGSLVFHKRVGDRYSLWRWLGQF